MMLSLEQLEARIADLEAAVAEVGRCAAVNREMWEGEVAQTERLGSELRAALARAEEAEAERDAMRGEFSTAYISRVAELQAEVGRLRAVRGAECPHRRGWWNGSAWSVQWHDASPPEIPSVSTYMPGDTCPRCGEKFGPAPLGLVRLLRNEIKDLQAEVERLRADAADMAGQWLCCWTHPDLILTGDEIERRAEIVQAWCAHRGIAVGEVTAPARDEVIASLQAEVERLRADARLQAENLRIARRSGDEARAQAAALRAARPDEELLERARVAVEQYLPLSGIYCAHPPSVEPADPAPGTREWAASAPLDEVRAWLDGRGVIDHRPAHMTDMYSRLVLVADGRTIASVSVTGTNAAALRALAIAVAERGERGATE